MNLATANRVAKNFARRAVREYVRCKVALDPVYPAVAAILSTTTAPVIDLGCGVGILPLYLRHSGVDVPVVGIDMDERKIAIATEDVEAKLSGATFMIGDARSSLPESASVVLLDVLHYFTDDDQERILEEVAAIVPRGGVCIIRDCVRDGTWRYRVTVVQESFSRAIRWLRAERLNFPAKDTMTRPFIERGFAVHVTPMYGPTPFNNYLIVARRSE